MNREHKPHCSINKICMVHHDNGICTHFKDCDCGLGICKQAENYDKKSHAHCWISENPPCGKKAHARCCLCEEPAPHIMKELEGKIAEGEERIKEWQKVKIAPQEKEHRVPYQKPIAPPTNDWEEEFNEKWGECNCFNGWDVGQCSIGTNRESSEFYKDDRDIDWWKGINRVSPELVKSFIRTLLKSKAVEIEEQIKTTKEYLNPHDRSIMDIVWGIIKSKLL